MTEQEYQDLQKQFSKKLIPHKWPTKTEEAYNDAVLACKSILHSFYQHQNKIKEEKRNE